MDHHIDISILPDPDFKPTLLMGVLFNKLHRALVALQSNRLAVSFPGYVGEGKHKNLGDLLRLHGTEDNLQALMATNWLKGMNDHVEQTQVRPVPQQHGYLAVSRVQCKSSVQRLRQRRMKRHGETAEQAAAAIPIQVEQILELPFVMVKSNSTKQQFKLFIRQTRCAKPNDDPTFNGYGLSQTGTVPDF